MDKRAELNLRMTNTKAITNGEIATDGLTSADLAVDEITSEIEIQKNSNLFKHELVLTIATTVALVLNT